MTPLKKRGFAGALTNLTASGLDGFGAENAVEFAKAIDSQGPEQSTGQRVEKIDVNLIDPSPDQSREVDWEWVQTLSENIVSEGLNTPINVRPHPEVPGRYLLIAGEHRWRAHIKANLPTVDALVNTTANAAKSASITLIENLLRKDLTPLEAARGLRRLVDEHGYTYAEAAKQLGKSKTWVSNHLGMLNLPAPVLDAIQSGTIRDYTVIANIGKAFTAFPDKVVAALTAATTEEPFTRADLQRIESSSDPAGNQAETTNEGERGTPLSPTGEGDKSPDSGAGGSDAETGHVGSGAASALPNSSSRTPPAGGSPPIDQKNRGPKKELGRESPRVPAQVVVALIDQDVELGILDLASEAEAGFAVISLAVGGSAVHPLSDLRMLGLRR